MFPWDRPLTNIDISNIIGQTPLKKIYRGTFSRDELAKLKSHKGIEAGIINLSRSNEKGTHWTAWFKHSNKTVCYYDSYGDLLPPPEFVQYMSHYPIYYNVDREQEFNSVICGQLSLCFLFAEYFKIKV
jgi:hypothetical protein